MLEFKYELLFFCIFTTAVIILYYLTSEFIITQINKYKRKKIMKDLMSKIMIILTDEGYRPEKDKDSIRFKCEGDTIGVTFNQDDPYYFRIVYFIGDFDEIEEGLILKIANQINNQFKFVCAVVFENGVYLTADSLSIGNINIRETFLRLFQAILGGCYEYKEALDKEIHLIKKSSLN